MDEFGAARGGYTSEQALGQVGGSTGGGPSASIAGTCHGRSETQAAYRRFDQARAIYRVVAWRLTHLVRLARIHPDMPAGEVFDQVGWQAAWLLAEKDPPKKPRECAKSSAAPPC